MGLVFYYLFHYLFFLPPSPPPLSPGIEGKHKSAAASLLCALVYIAVICSSGSPLRGGASTILCRHMWPLHGGFSCCFVRYAGCTLLRA